jgi:hypothetical protein
LTAEPSPTPESAVAEVSAQVLDPVVSASRFQAATGTVRIAATPSASSTPASSPPPTPAAAATSNASQVGDRVNATVTFYYCEDTTNGQRRGDGGGFCGTMRDGSPVYPGAAACDPAYLGQQFRIEGDPTERVYTCADTGGGIYGEHRDIWFMGNAEGWAWQQVVGTSAVIEILR